MAEGADFDTAPPEGPGFHGCYLLQSKSPKHKGKTYIGYTDEPARRIREHNGELANGAKKTSRARPWEIVLVVHGFPSNVAALQFEWAWQNPLLSSNVPQVIKTAPRTSLTGVRGKLKVLGEMLRAPSWRHLALTLSFSTSEWSALYGAMPRIPTHMPVRVMAPTELTPAGGKSRGKAAARGKDARTSAGVGPRADGRPGRVDGWSDGPDERSGGADRVLDGAAGDGFSDGTAGDGFPDGTAGDVSSDAPARAGMNPLGGDSQMGSFGPEFASSPSEPASPASNASAADPSAAPAAAGGAAKARPRALTSCVCCGEAASRTWWSCPSCDARHHVPCLAERRLEADAVAGGWAYDPGADPAARPLLPTGGTCASCGWAEAWPQVLLQLRSLGWVGARRDRARAARAGASPSRRRGEIANAAGPGGGAERGARGAVGAAAPAGAEKPPRGRPRSRAASRGPPRSRAASGASKSDAASVPEQPSSGSSTPRGRPRSRGGSPRGGVDIGGVEAEIAPVDAEARSAASMPPIDAEARSAVSTPPVIGKPRSTSPRAAATRSRGKKAAASDATAAKGASAPPAAVKGSGVPPAYTAVDKAPAGAAALTAAALGGPTPTEVAPLKALRTRKSPVSKKITPASQTTTSPPAPEVRRGARGTDRLGGPGAGGALSATQARSLSTAPPLEISEAAGGSTGTAMGAVSARTSATAPAAAAAAVRIRGRRTAAALGGGAGAACGDAADPPGPFCGEAIVGEYGERFLGRFGRAIFGGPGERCGGGSLADGGPGRGPGSVVAVPDEAGECGGEARSTSIAPLHFELPLGQGGDSSAPALGDRRRGSASGAPLVSDNGLPTPARSTGISGAFGAGVAIGDRASLGSPSRSGMAASDGARVERRARAPDARPPTATRRDVARCSTGEDEVVDLVSPSPGKEGVQAAAAAAGMPMESLRPDAFFRGPRREAAGRLGRGDDGLVGVGRALEELLAGDAESRTSGNPWRERVGRAGGRGPAAGGAHVRDESGCIGIRFRDDDTAGIGVDDDADDVGIGSYDGRASTDVCTLLAAASPPDSHRPGRGPATSPLRASASDRGSFLPQWADIARGRAPLPERFAEDSPAPPLRKRPARHFSGTLRGGGRRDGVGGLSGVGAGGGSVGSVRSGVPVDDVDRACDPGAMVRGIQVDDAGTTLRISDGVEHGDGSRGPIGNVSLRGPHVGDSTAKAGPSISAEWSQAGRHSSKGGGPAPRALAAGRAGTSDGGAMLAASRVGTSGGGPIGLSSGARAVTMVLSLLSDDEDEVEGSVVDIFT